MKLDKLIAVYNQQIASIGKAIEELMITDPVLKVGNDRLCAIKGLGLLSAATLVAETNCFAAFNNIR